MTLAGSGDAVEGVVGIAAHPQTGVLYVIVDTNPNNTSERRLASVNPATGVVTDIGPLGDTFCGLTFGSDGTLYAIHGHDNPDEAAVHTVDLATGATTLFRASDDVLAGGFPDGQGSYSIEFNPVDGRLYYSREEVPVFYQMNLATKLATLVAVSDDFILSGFAYEEESRTFVGFDIDNDEFIRVDPSSGDVTILGMSVDEGNQIRDVAFLPQSRSGAPVLGGVGIVLLLAVLFSIGLRRSARGA
jgi:hypothetical protein